MERQITIRGHHLSDYATLLQMENRLRNNGNPRAKELAVKVVATLAKNIALSSENKEDYCGTSQQTAEIYRERLENIFNLFLSLPDDAKVNLLVNTRDTMCNACIYGEHCGDSDPMVYPADNNFIKVLFKGEVKSGGMVTFGELKKRLLEINVDQLIAEGFTRD